MTHAGTTIRDLDAAVKDILEPYLSQQQRVVAKIRDLSEIAAKEAEIFQLCGNDTAAADYALQSKGLKELADKIQKGGTA
jgi:hypothetical protein